MPSSPTTFPQLTQPQPHCPSFCSSELPSTSLPQSLRHEALPPLHETHSLTSSSLCSKPTLAVRPSWTTWPQSWPIPRTLRYFSSEHSPPGTLSVLYCLSPSTANISSLRTGTNIYLAHIRPSIHQRSKQNTKQENISQVSEPLLRKTRK